MREQLHYVVQTESEMELLQIAAKALGGPESLKDPRKAKTAALTAVLQRRRRRGAFPFERRQKA